MKPNQKAAYRQRLASDFMAQRHQLGQMTPELLMIFADGKVDILKDLAAGLRTVAPDSSDLPMIHAVTHDLRKSTADQETGQGVGKGNKPIYSIPLQDVPQPLMSVIQASDYGSRRKLDLSYLLREILGAARRSNLPEELNHDALTAYRAELEVRANSAKTLAWRLQNVRCLGYMFKLDNETQAIIARECRSARLAAAHEPSKRHTAFRLNPLSPLDYARFARAVSTEAFSTQGNRQTVQRLFVTAGTLSLLSFIPERVSDIVGTVIGEDVKRDARGWSSAYFSRKSGVDRSFTYLPDQMTPYLDDLVLLGAEPGRHGSDLLSLYRYRVSLKSPLFARVDPREAYSPGRLFELVKERTGHCPHMARHAMTDYIAEIDGTPEDVLDLLGHSQIATSEKHYEVRAAAIRRKRTVNKIEFLREELNETGTFRLPTGRLIDLDKIARDLDQTS